MTARPWKYRVLVSPAEHVVAAYVDDGWEVVRIPDVVAVERWSKTTPHTVKVYDSNALLRAAGHYTLETRYETTSGTRLREVRPEILILKRGT